MSRCLYVGVTLLIMATSCGAGQPVRRSFQTSDKVNLSYLETGKEYGGGKSPTIALIPGWSMPANIWRRQLEQFGRNYQTLAIDPRGQGESDVPATGYSAERRATDLKEFLQPRANVLLIGWSLGAIESLQYIHMFGSGVSPDWFSSTAPSARNRRRHPVGLSSNACVRTVTRRCTSLCERSLPSRAARSR